MRVLEPETRQCLVEPRAKGRPRSRPVSVGDSDRGRRSCRSRTSRDRRDSRRTGPTSLRYLRRRGGTPRVLRCLPRSRPCVGPRWVVDVDRGRLFGETLRGGGRPRARESAARRPRSSTRSGARAFFMIRLYHYGDAETSGSRSPPPRDDRRRVSHHREGRPHRGDVPRGCRRSGRLGAAGSVLLRFEGRTVARDATARRGSARRPASRH